MHRKILIAVVFMTICFTEVFAQVVFEYEECDCDNTIYPESRINGEKKGVVLVYSEVNDLRFEMYNAKSERLLDIKHKDGKYILILEPMDESYRKAYGKYDILVKATGFQERHIYVKNVNPGSMCSFCCILRSPVESPLEKLAKITVYDRDGNLLEGAKVINKTTGYVYGSTRSDGTHAVNFEKKGDTSTVVVSHSSYSDTKEITVQAGNHGYTVYLHNYEASPREKRALIKVYDKDNNLLAGAEIKNKTTGTVYGSTGSDGVQPVRLSQKGETTVVIISHPSYSDTEEITVQAGVDKPYIVTLHNFNPNPPKQPHYNHSKTLAFFESAILPGLGQWGKGYVGHGLANMLGEAALIGGAVYFHYSAEEVSKQGLLDAKSVDDYNRNATLCNVFIGAAIALYTFNLIQAVLIRPNDDYYAMMTPTLLPVGNTVIPGFDLTFNF